jgi:hypothetical protein
LENSHKKKRDNEEQYVQKPIHYQIKLKEPVGGMYEDKSQGLKVRKGDIA